MNPHVRVSVRILFNKFRHHLRQRCVGVIVAFEGAKGVNQSSPFPTGYAHREQEHNLEVSGAGRHNAVATKPGSDQRRRNTGFFQFTIFTHSRSKDADFNRVEHTPVIRNIFEAVPAFARMHYPAVLNGGQQFGWCVSKVIGFAGLWVGDDFFVPRFEEPATVSGELFIQPRHRLTEINRFVDHFLRQ
ncbi:Uncharacterised protein [Shigella sonnei]|nr:Uncharacterised protein [Shigella sonnei]